VQGASRVSYSPRCGQGLSETSPTLGFEGLPNRSLPWEGIEHRALGVGGSDPRAVSDARTGAGAGEPGNKDDWIDAMRANGWRMVAVELAEDATPLTRLEPARHRTAVLLGHEGEGVPAEWVDAADDVWRFR
jgi:hypothetical protein